MTSSVYWWSGLRWRVVTTASGRFAAVGRCRGRSERVLYRIGSRPTREGMQAALDNWARKMGAVREVGE